MTTPCRTCLKPAKKLFNYSDPMACNQMDQTIADGLSVIMGIERIMYSAITSVDGGTPCKICSQCLVKLKIAYQFRLNCLESEAYFLSKINGSAGIEKLDVKIIEEQSVQKSAKLETAETTPPISEYEKKQNCTTPTNQLDPLYECCNKFFKLKINYQIHRKLNHSKVAEASNTNLADQKNEQEIHENLMSYRSDQNIYDDGNNLSNIPLINVEIKNNDHFSEPDAVDEQWIEDENGAIMDYTCDVCDKLYFVSAVDRDNHMKQMHIKKNITTKTKIKRVKQPYLCAFCGKTILNSTSYKNHLRQHGNKLGEIVEPPPYYECDICGKQFSRKGSIQDHFNFHLGTRPYKCEVCFKEFAHSSSVRTHRWLHYGKPIQCPICVKKFTIKPQLTNHLRIEHGGFRDHVCDICGKSYTMKQHLKQHRFSHLPKKAFKCNVCDKELVNEATFRLHMFIHNGKPHACPRCDATFNYKHILKKHLWKRHDVNMDDPSGKVSVVPLHIAHLEQ